jgi:hypothetical protein
VRRLVFRKLDEIAMVEEALQERLVRGVEPLKRIW